MGRGNSDEEDDGRRVDGNVGTLASLQILLTKNHPLRSPIITARQRPEPLLARRVPYRELVPLPVHLECLHLEVDADGRGGFVLGEEIVVREPEEEGGLAWRGASRQRCRRRRRGGASTQGSGGMKE